MSGSPANNARDGALPRLRCRLSPTATKTRRSRQRSAGLLTGCSAGLQTRACKNLECGIFEAPLHAGGARISVCPHLLRGSILAGRMISPFAAGIYAGLGAAAGAGLAAGAYAYASLWPGSRIFGTAITAPARPGELALTFDDGPNATWTPRLLDILARHEVRATFFLLGSRAAAQPELVRRIATAGHTIGNHSWSHPNLARTRSTRVSVELSRTSETLAANHRCAGKVFPAALWSAAAGRVSHCAGNRPGAGAVERDDLRLERALGRPDRGAA